MGGSLIGTLALGFVLGLKHALDADHVVAVSTIVGRERSIWKAARVGAVWGVGHTASLFAAAVAVVLLRMRIPPALGAGLECGVGLMVMALGADLLWRIARGEIVVHSHPHTHGDSAPHSHDLVRHAHLHVHTHADAAESASHHGAGRRPFYVGLVHGMAGSAVLMLFVLGTISSPWAALLYVLVFGVGTIGGMLILSGLIGLPFAVASRRFSTLLGRIQLAVGLGSVVFGAVYTWHVAVSDGLIAALLQ